MRKIIKLSLILILLISCQEKNDKQKVIITNSTFKTYHELYKEIQNYICDTIDFKFTFDHEELLRVYDHCDKGNIVHRNYTPFSISDDKFSSFNIDSIDYALDKHLEEYLINPRKLENLVRSPKQAIITIRFNKDYSAQQTLKHLKKIAKSYKKIKTKHNLNLNLPILLRYGLIPPPPPPSYKHVFFLHNRFLETHSIDESHEEYGKVEYHEIQKTFKDQGFNLYSEQRDGNVNAMTYARIIKSQIDSLLLKKVKPSNITVIGTSKGGYIAQYVSTLCANPKLNFVFIACYQDADIENIPELSWHGNVLNIYDRTDIFGESATKRIDNLTGQIGDFKELELNTGLNHGFLFKNSDDWTRPCIDWINKHY